MGIEPLERAYAPRFWRGELDVHALLYPREPFADVVDYLLFVQYTSTIQQLVAEGRDFDLSEWFVPGVREKQVASLETVLRGLPEPTSREASRRIVESWDLPAPFAWMSRLSYEAAWTRIKKDRVEMTAVAEEGYLCFFALRFS